jgi:hypothetical protein
MRELLISLGFVCDVLILGRGPTSREIVKGYPALVDYARRIHDKYFPDYELWE